jgi:hypothetical protein
LSRLGASRFRIRDGGVPESSGGTPELSKQDVDDRILPETAGRGVRAAKIIEVPRAASQQPSGTIGRDEVGGFEARSSSESGTSGQATPTWSLSRVPEGAGSGGGRSADAPRWGEYSRGATIGFKRRLRIEVHSDGLLIRDGVEIPVGRGESREQLAKQMMAALDDEVRAWGRPPQSFYWVPDVAFAVYPGGYQHYERARAELEQRGVSTSLEHVLENNEPLKPE